MVQKREFQCPSVLVSQTTLREVSPLISLQHLMTHSQIPQKHQVYFIPKQINFDSIVPFVFCDRFYARELYPLIPI